MSQSLTPINGGEKDIVISTSTKGVFLSQQYANALKLTPRPSEWLVSGRPIYDRLPSASQNYKNLFEEGEYDAFVYIPYGESELGRNSLSVVPSGDNNEFLVVQAGNVVWRRGTIPQNPVIINLQELGMWNTKYLLAYRLYFDDTPRVFQYDVKNFSLVGQDLAVGSSTDDTPGWRYTADLAFTGVESRPWSNLDPEFPDQESPAFLEWQTPYSCVISRIVLRVPFGFKVEGRAALSRLSCENQTEEGEYCSEYSWMFEGLADPKSDEQGFFYEFLIPEPTPWRGWRVDWDNPSVRIFQVNVDGILSLKRRPEEGSSIVELVAFPENSAPDFVDLGEGDQVRATYCNLALVDVNKEFRVTKVSDLRQIVKTDYTPIADWLTQPWDENLSSLFNTVRDYSNLWMSPVSSLFQEYEKLSKKSIEVS